MAGGGTAVVAAMPWIISQMFFSPTGIKWLTVGLKAPRGSKEVTKALIRLAAVASTRPGEKPVEE